MSFRIKHIIPLSCSEILHQFLFLSLSCHHFGSYKPDHGGDETLFNLKFVGTCTSHTAHSKPFFLSESRVWTNLTKTVKMTSWSYFTLKSNHFYIFFRAVELGHFLTFILMCPSFHIYIYIEREREREREIYIRVYIYKYCIRTQKNSDFLC